MGPCVRRDDERLVASSGNNSNEPAPDWGCTQLSSPGLTGRSSTPGLLDSITAASGILDHPLEPVIGLAKGETRWRVMTRVGVPQLSSPGLTGRSSTPWLLDSITAASGILDHPPSRVMTTVGGETRWRVMTIVGKPQLSSPGLTGRSSTPWPFDSITAVSGILDHPPSRVMTMVGGETRWRVMTAGGWARVGEDDAVSINTSSRRTPGPIPRCALDRDDVADDLRITDAGGYGSLRSQGRRESVFARTVTLSRRKTPEFCQ
jgi:hypothetical protein